MAAAPGMLTVDNSQFDLARKRAQQQSDATVQGQRDALARRAAQTGGGVSGALVKQEQMAEQAGGERVANANEGINAQQMQEGSRINEINTGRQYQTSEREAGQGFASGEALKGRQFATSERQGSEKFADYQRNSSQKFADYERIGSQVNASREAGKARDWQGKQADIERAQRMDQFTQQLGFSKEQFAHEQVVDQWNKDLADRIQGFNEKPGMLEGLFGGGSPSFGNNGGFKTGGFKSIGGGGSYGGGGGGSPWGFSVPGYSGGGLGTGGWM